MSVVVIAPDSFKGSREAVAVAHALAEGWLAVRPGDTVVCRPMADGGEGTLDVVATARSGARRMPVRVRGPHGREVPASWLLLPDGTGVVELASTSGIELLGANLRPWDADTFGFGQAIAAALDHGVERLVLGVGSSASTDGGAGLLLALGARLTDASGAPIRPGLRGLADVAAVDLRGMRALPPGGALALSDVDNPLRGPRGAAAVFGPQKGLAGEDLAAADAALARWAGLLGPEPADSDGDGAAGGTGFALRVWGAELTPGAATLAELTGLARAVAGADLVITGEGRYDGQSAAGKAPAFVAGLAAAAGVPVALVAGRIDADADLGPFREAEALTLLAGDAASAQDDPDRWLRAAAGALATRAPFDA